jgi:hypothetical protein
MKEIHSVTGDNEIVPAAELCFHVSTLLQAPLFTYINIYTRAQARTHKHTHNIGQYDNNRLFSTIFPHLKNVVFVVFHNKQCISQISKILRGFQSYMDAQYQK